MKKILFTIVVLLQLFHFPTVKAADDLNFGTTMKNFQESVGKESVNVQDGAQGITLPSFQDGTTEGADAIVATIKRFLDFFKLIVTPIAILFTVVMGFKMVTAGRENEEVATQSKNYIRYALEGLVVIFIADSLISVLFGAQGEVFRGGEAGAQEFAGKTSTLLTGMYGLAETIIATIAVFVLVTAGMRYVGGSYDDDQIAKAKKQIQWALVGLFVVGISEYVVKGILFQDQGARLGVSEAKQLFAQLTNFLAGTMGTIAFASLLYAGYLYVMGVQNEDNVAKAKKIMMWSLGGIIIALAAFAITNTVTTLDATR